MKVKVYWNLHKKMWSIMSADRLFRKNRVVGHADAVKLYDITFKVGEGGRKRVIKEGRKNVHAYAEGHLLAVTGAVWKDKPLAPEVDMLKPAGGEVITYNPYKNETFMAAGTPCRWASWAVFEAGKVYGKWPEMYHPDFLLENDATFLEDYYNGTHPPEAIY